MPITNFTPMIKIPKIYSGFDENFRENLKDAMICDNVHFGRLYLSPKIFCYIPYSKLQMVEDVNHDTEKLVKHAGDVDVGDEIVVQTLFVHSIVLKYKSMVLVLKAKSYYDLPICEFSFEDHSRRKQVEKLLLKNNFTNFLNPRRFVNQNLAKEGSITDFMIRYEGKNFTPIEWVTRDEHVTVEEIKEKLNNPEASKAEVISIYAENPEDVTKRIYEDPEMVKKLDELQIEVANGQRQAVIDQLVQKGVDKGVANRIVTEGVLNYQQAMKITIFLKNLNSGFTNSQLILLSVTQVGVLGVGILSLSVFLSLLYNASQRKSLPESLKGALEMGISTSAPVSASLVASIIAQQGLNMTAQASSILGTGVGGSVDLGIRTTIDFYRFMHGQMSKNEIKKNLIDNSVGVSGAVVGGTIGAGIGSTVGTLLFPGVGTLSGGVIGGVIGGIAIGTPSAMISKKMSNNVTSDVYGDDYTDCSSEFLVILQKKIHEGWFLLLKDTPYLIQCVTFNKSLARKFYAAKDKEAFVDKIYEDYVQEAKLVCSINSLFKSGKDHDLRDYLMHKGVRLGSVPCYIHNPETKLYITCDSKFQNALCLHKGNYLKHKKQFQLFIFNEYENSISSWVDQSKAFAQIGTQVFLEDEDLASRRQVFSLVLDEKHNLVQIQHIHTQQFIYVHIDDEGHPKLELSKDPPLQHSLFAIDKGVTII